MDENYTIYLLNIYCVVNPVLHVLPASFHLTSMPAYEGCSAYYY